MTYNEKARRILERQGWDEWMGPKAAENERKAREEFARRQEAETEGFVRTRSLPSDDDWE